MSTFDPTDYFARLNQQAAEQERVNPVQDKFQALQRASAEKIEILNKDITKLKQLELVNAGSLVGRMELDPDSIAGKTTNLLASAYSGASRVAGDILGFVGGDLEALVRDANLSEPEKQAIGKYWQGTASPEEIALINRSKGQGAYSPLQHAEKAREARQRSADINSAFDRSGTVHQGARSELSDQLGESFQDAWGQTTKGAEALWTGEGEGRLSGTADLTAGLAKLLFNAGDAAISNPGAAAEYMAENAPQLVLGMAGKLGKVALTMSNVGYASEEYQKGIEKYQSENRGAYPPEELRMKMAAAAASLALAEQVGDLSLLKGARGAADAAKETAKTGFLQSMKNIAGVTAKGTLTEAATEGYQTWAEGVANLTPATPEQIYEGAVIGGMSGGGLAGGGRAIGEALKATPEHVAERQEADFAKEAARKAQEAAIASGDVSVLLDRKNASYSPSNAIAALYGNASAEDATQEVKDGNLAQAVKIVSRLQDERDNYEAQLKNTTPEGQAELEKGLAAETDPEKIAVYKEFLAEGKEISKKDLRSLEVKFKRADDELKLAQENLDRFTGGESSKTIPALVQVATAKVEAPAEEGVAATPAVDPQTRTKAARSLIVLAMRAPDKLDVATAKAMADDTSLELTEDERQYFRVFSAARVAQNKLRDTEKVNSEVTHGSKKHMGLAQYQKRMGIALESGNKKEASRLLGLLRNFNESHTNKAAVVTEAWKKGFGTQIEHIGNNQWKISTVHRDKAFRDENGGLELRSKELVAAIPVEATAISAVLAELEAAYAVKFGPAVNVATGSPASVKDVPQAPALQPTPVEEKPAGTDSKTAPAGAAQGTTLPTGGKAADRGSAQEPVTPASVTKATEKQDVQQEKGTGTDEGQEQTQKGLLTPEAGATAPAMSHIEATQFLIDEYQERLGTLKHALKKATKEDDQRRKASFEKHIATVESEIAQFENLKKVRPDLKKAAQLVYKVIRSRSTGNSDIAGKLAKVAPEIYLKIRKLAGPYFQVYTTNIGGIKQILADLQKDQRIEVVDVEVESLSKEGYSPEVAREIAELRNENASLQESMVNRPETGPDAEAAVGAKNAKIGRNLARIDVLLRTKKDVPSVKKGVPPWDDLPETTAAAPEVTEGNSQAAQEPVVDQQEATTESPEVTSEGKLSLFEENEEGNPVAAGFMQEPARENDTTKRPLVMVKDFLDSLIDRAQEFVEERLSDEQYAALDKFVNQARSWEAVLARNLPKRKDPKYRYEDVIQYLLKDPTRDGELSDMDQNVFTAISYSAYSWVAAEVGSPAIQSQKSVNDILGLQKDAWAGKEAYEVLGPAGSYQHLLMDSLGGAVLDALGLKAKGDTPQDLMPKLRGALGAHALRLLEDSKLVKRTTVSDRQMAGFRKQEDFDERAFHTFYAIARDADGYPVPAALGIKKANKGTAGILDKLFKVASGFRVPLLTPSTVVSATTKGTSMQTPERLKEIILANQARPRKIRQDILGLLGQMPEEMVHTMIGMVAEEDSEVHVVNRMGVMAKNQGLKREYDLFIEFIGEHLVTAPEKLDTPFFYEFSVWKQQRVGIATNVGNPQTSKIARHMIYSPAWEVTINSTDEAAMNSFFLRVAEGLGMKTERVDNTVSIDKVKETLEDGVFKAGIDALRKSVVRGEELTEVEQGHIVAAVKAGGEKLHSLDALIGVAQQVEAMEVAGLRAYKANQEDDSYNFTVKMMGEVDGVANGTMLNHILVGAGNTVGELQEMLHAGGFFEEGSEHTQYNLWRGTPGHLDIYESTARDLHTAVQALLADSDEAMQSKINAIWNVAGNIFDVSKGTVTKDGRNLVKDALNPLAFGSALPNVVKGMATAFLKNVYAGFEDLSKGQASQEEVDAYVNSLNTIVSGTKVRPLPLGRPIAWHMEQALHASYEGTLMRVFGDTIGEATAEVVGKKFSSFLARRDALNNTANVVFGISDAIYQGTRKAYIEELVQAGEIKLNDKGERIGDLTKKQEKELAKRLRFVDPIIQTSMSKIGDGRKAGLRMAKLKRKQNSSPEYANRTQFNSPVKGRGSVTVRGMSPQQEEPGVAMGSATTHSTDSFISHMTQAIRDVLNVHDAVGEGVLGLQESARLMNQHTWQAMLSYSPLEEVHQSLAVVIRGLAHMVAKEQITPEAVKAVQSYLYRLAQKEGSDPSDLFEDLLVRSKNEAYLADSTKLEMMSKWVSVDQYAFQGGNYEVTPEDRAKAASDLKKLTTELGVKNTAALEVLAGFMKIKPSEVKVTSVAQDGLVDDDSVLVDGDTEADTEAIVNVDLEPAPVIKAVSPFGPLGTPKKINKPLQEFFKANPEASGQKVLTQLSSMMGGSNQFQRLLVGMLRKSMPADIKVRLVTKDMTANDVLAMPETQSFGWIAGNEIYILSDEFENSGLQIPEILLHELVHGSLADVVQKELDAREANPEYRSDALRLVDELERLMAKAKEHAASKGITTYDAALSNVHEFIAYGMTHKSFQRLLSEVTAATDPLGNRLINGLTQFVQKLVGLLYKGSTKSQEEQATTALYALIENVSGLFNQATEYQGNSRTGPVLSMTAVQDYTTQDIHEALEGGSISPSFDAKLSSLLGGIVRQLHGPFGAFKAGLMAQQALTPQDVWLKALETGVAPLALSVTASPIASSQKELHAMEQVETTVRAALELNEVSTRTAYRELSVLFTQMRDKLKPSDFKDPKEYDFIFDTTLGADGKSHHLARFAAFTLAHEGFNKLMQQATEKAPKEKAVTIGDKVQRIFERILAFFVERMTHTYNGQPADEKLTTLVGQLVDIEAKRRLHILRNQNRVNPLASFDTGGRFVADKLRAGVVKVAGSKLVKESRFTTVKLAGAVTRIVANDQVEHFIGVLRKFRDDNIPGLHGLVPQMLSQVKGMGQMLNLLQLASTNMQKHRKEIIAGTSKVVLDSFLEGGKNLDKAKASISQVFLRTGMHVLTDQYDMAQLEKLMEDPKALQSAISEVETELKKFPALTKMVTEYIHKANALGYYRVTGKAKHKAMMMNAHNIARLYFTGYAGRVTESQAKAVEPIIEKLVSLYALEYVKDSDIKQALAVLKAENTRKDGGNGVEFILKLQKKLAEDSKDALFRNQAALITHGYAPEIYNQDTLVEVASAEAGKELENQGFYKVHQVGLDPADPDKTPMFLYALRNGGLARYQSGIFSTTGKVAKGSKYHSGYLNVHTEDGQENASINADIASAKPGGLATGSRPDLRKTDQTYMVPVVNPSGMVVNWRYMMHDSTKDTVLERDNRFEHILGAYAGSIYDKVQTTKTNGKAIKALAELYEKEQFKEANAYVLVSPMNPEPSLREAWDLLPDETKHLARAAFGKDGMYVRKDMLLPVFGFRKYSMSEAFRKDPKARGYLEKVLVYGVEHILLNHYRLASYRKGIRLSYAEARAKAKKAAVLVTRFEKGWQELVGEVKDIIVIKSITVLRDNIFSNLSFLVLAGVPLRSILRDHLVALKAASKYEEDREELAELQLLVDTGMEATVPNAKAEIRRLQDSLNRNPAKELIDAGLMPTIVEDVVQDDDPYSYKSQLTKKIDKYKSKVNPTVMSGLEWLYMAHTTKPYQMASRVTRVSDFVARYTLYQHLTTRKDKPLKREEALHEASESFINYDSPLPKQLDYLDGMGIMPFMKYYIRVQRVLMKLLRDNPGRVLGTILLNNLVDLGPIVLDSAWVHRIGNNPFQPGAAQLPWQLDEIGPIAGALAIVK
jgi:hypothetical protein